MPARRTTPPSIKAAVAIGVGLLVIIRFVDPTWRDFMNGVAVGVLVTVAAYFLDVFRRVPRT